MTATAYQTQGGSGNYLHIAITSAEIKPGDNLPVNFNVRGNANSLNQIQYFTYLVSIIDLEEIQGLHFNLYCSLEATGLIYHF